MMARVHILKAGSKLPELDAVFGDFEDWIRAGLDETVATEVVNVAAGGLLPPPRTVDAVIVTGSPAMVTDPHGWIARAADWLGELAARGTPTLGICFGHQLLAHALGGEVSDNPAGVEVGTVTATLTPEGVDDALLGAGAPSLPVQASHQQRVMRLPEGAVLLATTERDPHHAFRYGYSAWGVQFHPEFSAEVTSAYVRYYQQQGKLDEAQANAPVSDTPVAASVLHRFAELLV